MSRDALIVGVNLYEDEQLANLKAPATDAEAVAQLLTDYGDFRVKRLPEIIKDNTLQVGRKTKVSLTQLEAALVQLFLPKGQHIPDTALFYFSGHGIRKEQGIAEGFLATSDAYPQLGFYGLSLPWLRRLLRESPVRQQIVWLDCCHSGELLNFAEADPGDRGKGRDRCFIAASREFEAAYEDVSGRHSVLTGALLQGLDPTRQENRAVTNYDLIDFLNQALKSATQRPLFANSGGQILLTGTGAESVNLVLAGICPYKGLTYFDCNEEDPKYFYGRTALTDQLLEKVRQGNFLAVLGASGSGKSSVVRAGLLHQLKLGQRLSGSQDWQLYIFRPGEHPLKRLAEVFVESGLSAIDRANQLVKAEELIGTGDVGLGHLITAVEGSRVVLVVDQFEEVFTLCQDKTERQQFFECLLKAKEREDNKLCLVLTMRADFFGKCAEYGELASQIQQHLVTVTPMTPEELEQAITEPAKKVGLEVERELVTEMMADVQGSPGSLPLLQYTLTELWKQRTVERLTLSAYTRLGGVKGTLQKRANEVYESLSPEEQQTAKRIFLELTQLGEGTEDTRRQVKKRDLVSTEQSQALVDSVIQRLADAKLVVTSTLVEKGLSSEPVAVVDVAHEALIRHWGRLRQWLTENRNALRQKRSIEADAQEWLDKSKARDYLLQGLKLAEAEAFFQRNFEGVSLSLLGQEFVKKSIWRRKSNLRRRIGIVASVIVSLSGLTIFSFIQTREAQRQNKEAQRQSITAKIQASEAFFSSGKQLDALVEAVQAGKNLKDTNLEQNANLNQAVTVKLQQLVYGVQERNRLLGHDGDITSVAFSPDGKIIASASDDGTIKLWNLEGHEIKTQPMSHNSHEVSFSPDSKMLVSAGTDGKIKLWSLEGEELNTLIREYPNNNNIRIVNTSDVLSVSFSPNGKTIASVSNIQINRISTQAITLWNLEGQILKTFPLPENEEWIDKVYSVRFSPDGKTIATGSASGIIRFLDLEGQELPNSPMYHGKTIREVNFSPDGKTIASASGDGTIKLWNLEGEELHTFTGHSENVYSVNFSPDGKTIASASGDGTIKLWNLEGEELHTFTGHSGYISSVSFSPDGKILISGGGDKKIRLWNIERQKPQTFIGHLWEVTSVTFSPDGQIIASGSEDETIKLWNLEGQVLKTFSGHTEGITDISFSPDGHMLASASEDKTARIWNIEGEELINFTGHNDTVSSVMFSPDGKMIASGSSNFTKIWNLEGQEITTLFGNYASFNSDGNRIASSDFEDINLWNLEGKKLKTLRGHSDYIYSVSFSPDGKIVASAGRDKTIKLWNIETQEVKNILDYTTVIDDVSFSPDGKLIASVGSADGLRLWSRNGQPLFHLNDRAYLFYDADFSPDGKRLALGLDNQLTGEGTVMLLNFDLDELLGRSCYLLREYLKTPSNGMSKDDSRRDICDDVKPAPQLLIQQGKELIEKGDIKGAITFYKKAQELDPNLKITVYSWNALCWNGSLRGYAKNVMFACENAVSLASEDVHFYRDSRGLARALTGDTKGAIEDFEAYIKWAENKKQPDDYKIFYYRTQRQGWIDALRAGENPFTPEEKERLLNE